MRSSAKEQISARKVSRLEFALTCGTSVTLQVDARSASALNGRSRAATKKVGATEEGILRCARITRTGFVFDRVIFSVG